MTVSLTPSVESRRTPRSTHGLFPPHVKFVFFISIAFAVVLGRAIFGLTMWLSGLSALAYAASVGHIMIIRHAVSLIRSPNFASYAHRMHLSEVSDGERYLFTPGQVYRCYGPGVIIWLLVGSTFLVINFLFFT